MASEASAILPEAVRTKLVELDASCAQIDRDLADPAVIADHTRIRDLSVKKAALDSVVTGWRRLAAIDAELEELHEATSDPELAELAKEEIPKLREEATRLAEQVKAALVNADDRKIGSVILEIRAGTGGDEAGLWARDLLGVYEKHAAKRGWKTEEMSLNADEIGGVRAAVVQFAGEGVWSELGFESGVHSVKRVPETETQGRVHTSTCTVAVLAEREEVEVSIDWAGDVEEHVTTAQGPGGQNVNKVATAVHMIHKPTGVEVRMQETKSQAQNRDKAKRLLAARVAEIEHAKAEAERSADRKAQIGTGQRSEKIRVYRYQDGIVADSRLSEKFQLRDILAGDLGPMYDKLIEQQTAERLAAL